MNLNLKKPCANCPFLKKGAIELRKGRIEGIAQDLIDDDRTPFLCHKTVFAKNANGTHVENEDGTTSYKPGTKDSACVGSMVFLLKAGAPNVSMRMGAALGLLDYKALNALNDLVIEPQSLNLKSSNASFSSKMQDNNAI